MFICKHLRTKCSEITLKFNLILYRALTLVLKFTSNEKLRNNIEK